MDTKVIVIGLIVLSLVVLGYVAYANKWIGVKNVKDSDDVPLETTSENEHQYTPLYLENPKEVPINDKDVSSVIVLGSKEVQLDFKPPRAHGQFQINGALENFQCDLMDGDKVVVQIQREGADLVINEVKFGGLFGPKNLLNFSFTPNMTQINRNAVTYYDHATFDTIRMSSTNNIKDVLFTELQSFS